MPEPALKAFPAERPEPAEEQTSPDDERNRFIETLTEVFNDLKTLRDQVDIRMKREKTYIVTKKRRSLYVTSNTLRSNVEYLDDRNDFLEAVTLNINYLIAKGVIQNEILLARCRKFLDEVEKYANQHNGRKTVSSIEEMQNLLDLLIAELELWVPPSKR